MSHNAPTLVGKKRAIVERPRAGQPGAAEPGAAQSGATRSDAAQSGAARSDAIRSRVTPSTAGVGDRPQGLRICRQGQASVEVELNETQRYVLGRHDAADVSFDLDAVSRLHGVIRFAQGSWLFEDYASLNGSVVVQRGEATIVEPHMPICLGIGDSIELGTEDASVELIGRPQLPSATDQQTEISDAARNFSAKIAVAAKTKVPVFLFGPSGCGKTHTARQIHQLSRATGPFVPINCARLPSDASALHSELLGHVKGAFTGADTERQGKLVYANGGTLFLDEVESLSHLGQGFLLDVLEGSGDLSPLGSRKPLLHAPIFRLLSASKTLLGHSSLRADLCERLAEGHMWRVPTLVERRQDIPGMVLLVASQQSKLLGVEVVVSPEAMELAQAADWPGQIRQLRATVSVLAQMAVARVEPGGARSRRFVLTASEFEQHLQERQAAFGDVLSFQAGPVSEGGQPRQKADARSLTREQVLAILVETEGNRSEAARRLGIARNTFARKVREFGLE